MGPQIQSAVIVSGRMMVTMKGTASKGAAFSFWLNTYEPLANTQGIENFIVSSDCKAIQWPELGIDVTIEDLIKDVFGIGSDSDNEFS